MKKSHLFGFVFTAVIGVTLIALRPAAADTPAAMAADTPPAAGKFFAADNKNIQYMGRIDFSNPKLPRFWASACTIRAKFRGAFCDAVINDQVLWGNSHNYIEVIVDDKAPYRIQTTGPVNTIHIAQGLSAGVHTVTLSKDTESGIGYLEFVGFQCEALARPSKMTKRKMEFIGDSITCGTGSDESVLPCGKGNWYDQHNAYMSYGPTTARALDAQWQVTSASGIGLIHSCCDMKVVMPDVFDKMSLSNNEVPWDFHRYQPDVVTICLGQNDGSGQPAAFRDAYIKFIGTIRSRYPKAQIVCLNSPMGNAELTAFMKDILTRIVTSVQQAGDSKVHAFFFSRAYNNGCGGHPNMADHQLIAGELAQYVKTTFGW